MTAQGKEEGVFPNDHAMVFAGDDDDREDIDTQ